MDGTAALSFDGDRMVLSGVLDFDTVLALQTQGQQWIETAAPAQFGIDLGAVSYSSSAGLALLLDWLRTAAAGHKQVQLHNMPDDMQALLRVSGLEQVLPRA